MSIITTVVAIIIFFVVIGYALNMIIELFKNKWAQLFIGSRII